MPTESIFTGRETRLLRKPEVSYGEPPAGNWTQTLYYTADVSARTPLEDDPVLGPTGATARDPFDPAPGLTEAGGSMSVPLDLAHLGYWLRLACGAPTTTGAANFTHVFASGASVLPTDGLELKVAAAEYRQYIGVGLQSFRLAMQKEAGFRRCDLQLIAKGERKLGASGGGVPAAMATRAPVPATTGVVRWNGTTIGKALASDITYATGLEGERYLDSGTFPDEISALVPASDPTLSGSIRVRAPVATLDDAGIDRTPGSLELEWALSGTLSLLIAAPRTFMERAPRPITGPGGVEQTVGFRAAQSDVAAMMTVTLKNQVASYA